MEQKLTQILIELKEISPEHLRWMARTLTSAILADRRILPEERKYLKLFFL